MLNSSSVRLRWVWIAAATVIALSAILAVVIAFGVAPPPAPLSQHHDLSTRFILLHAAMRLSDLVKVEGFAVSLAKILSAPEKPSLIVFRSSPVHIGCFK